MVSCENLTKIYRTGGGEVKALDGVDLRIEKGEFVVVRGPSGSGKTTLLMIIGGMLRPTEGRVIVNGKDLYSMGTRERAKFRAENIGFVFQMFHLVPYLNVIENVLLAAGARGNRGDRDRARELLDRLGLADREHHRPSQLSVGESQRVAIARAMFNRPKLILADEPTGNLDPKTSEEVFGYLDEFHREGGTVLVVTHGGEAERYADRILQLQEGRMIP
ncbi:TPA: ABC transporter ATP-binding protein [Candidatus Poribacteria bacterium]|nr:ABC transporter ATP-binding protein [Candidatus Poribacteria bacterium]